MELGRRVFAVSGLVVAAVVWFLPSQDSDKDLTLGGHVSARRGAYIEEKTEIDRQVLQHFQHLEIPPAAEQKTPKVAFLFLTKQKIQTVEVWKRFFKDAPRDRYSIYVHESRGDERSAEEAVYQPLAEYGARKLPFINGTWCALGGLQAGAMHMMLQDPSNVQFAILSETCIPLKSFAHMYRQLVELSPKTSKICITDATPYKKMSDHLQYDGSTGCVFRDYYSRYEPLVRQHHQWLVMSREHAATFVRRGPQSLDSYYNTWRQAVPDWQAAGFGCSDEAIALHSLVSDLHSQGRSSGDYSNDLKLAGVEQRCLTFVHWHGCLIGHKLNRDNDWKFIARLLTHSPLHIAHYLTGRDIDFLNNPLQQAMNSFPYEFKTAIEIEYLQELAEDDFMFARKFYGHTQVLMTNGSREPLADVLPGVWRHVDEAGRPASPWARIQNPDLPPPYSAAGRLGLFWLSSFPASIVTTYFCDNAPRARALSQTWLVLSSLVFGFLLISKSGDIN